MSAILLEFVKATVQLLALAVLQSLLMRVWPRAAVVGQMVSGLLFGAIAVVGMAMPIELTPGIIFDVRSVTLAVAGFWGGPIVGGIAALLAGIFRSWVGGDGTWVGVAMIFGAVAIGLTFRFLTGRAGLPSGPVAVLAFGIVLQGAGLASIYLLPGGIGREIVGQVGWPMMVALPPATLLLVALLRDVDRRFEEERKVRESEARFRDIADCSADWFFERDAKGVVTFVSDGFKRTTGIDQSWLLGKTAGEIFDVESISSDWADVRAQAAEHKPFRNVIVPIHRPGGGHLWVRTSGNPRFGPEGDFLGYRGVTTDITEQRTVENALRKSEKRYRNLIEAMSEGIWQVDAAGRTLFVNSQMAEMLKTTAADLMGRTMLEFVDPEWTERARKYMDRRRIGIAERYELLFRRADDTKLWALVNATPQLDEQGDFVSATAVVMDITRQKRTDARVEALEATIDRESRLFQMGELVATIAHQLNQPLTVAGSYAQGLVDAAETAGSKDESVVELARLIHEQVNRASGTVRHIREFLARRNPVHTAVDVNEAMREAVAMVSRHARVHDILIRSRSEPTLPLVMADSILLQQVIVNLLENAVDAMVGVQVDDSTVTVTTGLDESGMVVVTVEDVGPGLDDEVLDHAFDAFFSHKEHGLGMGLAVCRSIVESFGGRIEARNRDGGGAVFTVMIPVVTDDEHE